MIDRFSTNEDVGYSQAAAFGKLVFVSGQVGWDGLGQVVGPGDIRSQAEQAFANLERALVTAGSGLANVLKITVYITDARYVGQVREVRNEVFGAHDAYPASTFAVITALADPALLIEVEAIAVIAKK
jgi:2-iminobutanoate/2-iminopropanoate deaminase